MKFILGQTMLTRQVLGFAFLTGSLLAFPVLPAFADSGECPLTLSSESPGGQGGLGQGLTCDTFLEGKSNAVFENTEDPEITLSDTSDVTKAVFEPAEISPPEFTGPEANEETRKVAAGFLIDPAMVGTYKASILQPMAIVPTGPTTGTPGGPGGVSVGGPGGPTGGGSTGLKPR